MPLTLLDFILLGIMLLSGLLALMRGETPASKRLPAEIVIRASTGRPPATA